MEQIFSLPEPMINKETARIMSLRDGTQKMSKSDLSDYSRINLMDDNDQIALKIKKKLKQIVTQYQSSQSCWQIDLKPRIF